MTPSEKILGRGHPNVEPHRVGHLKLPLNTTVSVPFELARWLLPCALFGAGSRLSAAGESQRGSCRDGGGSCTRCPVSSLATRQPHHPSGHDRRIHSVITGGIRNSVVDARTGNKAFLDVEEADTGGALFHAGTMRRLMARNDGVAYIGDNAKNSDPLAKIKATGRALPNSRSIIWALARGKGYDPSRWQLEDKTLLTWGGQTLNVLLAAIFQVSNPDRKFSPSPTAIDGDVQAIDLSIESIRDLAKDVERTRGIPMQVAAKFLGPSRFIDQMSIALVAEEKRRAVPWKLLHRWLDHVGGIDM